MDFQGFCLFRSIKVTITIFPASGLTSSKSQTWVWSVRASGFGVRERGRACCSFQSGLAIVEKRDPIPGQEPGLGRFISELSLHLSAHLYSDFFCGKKIFTLLHLFHLALFAYQSNPILKAFLESKIANRTIPNSILIFRREFHSIISN